MSKARTFLIHAKHSGHGIESAVPVAPLPPDVYAAAMRLAESEYVTEACRVRMRALAGVNCVVEVKP